MATFRIPLKVASVILSVAIGLTLNLSESSEANNKTQPQSGVGRAPDSQDSDALKLKTTLVIVPVIASDHNGIYIPDMQKNEFTLLEDGVKQNIAFFAITSEPFNVILMLDTSRSTSQKLGQIKQAAIAFVDQLRPLDRVKVISFDDEVRDLKGFTSDKATLRSAIERTRTGGSTRLYDAFRLALENLRRKKGRKAIVLLTDGVDTRSHSTTYADNLRELEESGVIVYPIRYSRRDRSNAPATSAPGRAEGHLGCSTAARTSPT
jgi:VWFA-related protein